MSKSKLFSGLTSENVRDLARQFVSIDNISELGTIGVYVKERIIEATLMGDIEKTVREAIKALSYQSMDRLDTIVKEVKESARPQRSTKGKSGFKIQWILDNVYETDLFI